MVGYGMLACSPLVTVKINGFGKFVEHLKFYILTFFGCLKSCESIYHVTLTCT